MYFRLDSGDGRLKVLRFKDLGDGRRRRGSRKASLWFSYLYSEHWWLDQRTASSMVTVMGSRNPVPEKVIHRARKQGLTSRESESDGDGTGFVRQQE